ncbi:MAG: hypothetical protein MJ149_02390 [Clostridia bacterium]|nr:hypothetical protein [Clostridia bacterium]
MKKFFKVLFIILVVGGAIGVTCFFFFKNLQKEKDSFAAVNNFVYGVEEEEFVANVDKAKTYVETYDANDKRFTVLKETSSNLISIAKVLDYYLLNIRTHKVDQNKIVDYVNDVIVARDNCGSAFAKFFTKCEGASAGFNVSLAANTLFEDVTRYVQKYATFVDGLNAEVGNIVSKNMDVKFNYFEVYSKSIALQMLELDATATIHNLKNESFVKTLNDGCNIQNGQVVVHGDSYNGNINKFIENYAKCDAKQFAEHLKTNLTTCTSITKTSTDEAKATYYFYVLFVA